MNFVDRLIEFESERSALIVHHPTETGGCSGCRRWPQQFRILDENDVDLHELTCSKGNSKFYCVKTKRGASCHC
jgi:hypothetical protein